MAFAAISGAWIGEILAFAPMRAKPIECRVSGNGACPPFKSAGGMEPGMGSMDAPERLYGHVFGGCLIAHKLHDPAIDGALVQAKERFESV